MSEQILSNPYKRIETMERALKTIGTWARVDIANKADRVKRSLPPCLRAQDVVALVDKAIDDGGAKQ